MVFIVGLPIFSLVGIYWVDRRIRRTGRSKVYYPPMGPAEIDLEGDFNGLLENCKIELENMGAKIHTYDDKLRLIKADIRNNEITVKIRGIRGVRKRLFIASDSKLLSVRFDFGENRRNVETLLSRLSS